ncbi:MAG: sugar ABC transporter permease [Alphaproteobacteria bacterium]|nr:sugar ABC transporter permease [Alphaproteobacteria bacterium]
MSAIEPTPSDTPIRNQLVAGRVRSAWIFLTPMLVTLIIVAAWPLARSIWFSLTDASLLHYPEAKFIGLGNYYYSKTITMDSGATTTTMKGVLVDGAWWNAVWNTIRFGLVSVLLETLLGMAVALVLNAEFKGRGIVRAAILVPWAIPTVVSAKMWGWMLNDQLGIINDLLLRMHVISEKIAWAADANYSMIAIVAVDTWKTVPFMALLILAGLQQVPGDVYEAASIDGVHPIKVFWKITLPLIRPALMVAVIFRLLDALRIFDLVYILTPNSSQTKTMSVISRENMFDFDKLGYGSAESTLLFLVLLVMVTLYMKLGRVNFDGGVQ